MQQISKQRIVLYALHGFLGGPEDWDFLKKGLGDFDGECKAIDLFNEPSFAPNKSLKQWSTDFNAFVRKETDDSYFRVIVGYSLGGRLAMHALLDSPSVWRAAVIISAHPGLKSDEERRMRFLRDCQWAERFEQTPWAELMSDWNNQEVFRQDGLSPERLESHYSRKTLAAALRNWSSGLQEDLASSLAKVNAPILWIAGQKDKKYADLAQTMHFAHPQSQIWIAPKSGHRVPWSARKDFCSVLNAFLKQVFHKAKT